MIYGFENRKGFLRFQSLDGLIFFAHGFQKHLKTAFFFPLVFHGFQNRLKTACFLLTIYTPGSIVSLYIYTINTMVHLVQNITYCKLNSINDTSDRNRIRF